MSAPEFLARLALRSRGPVERAVPSIAPLFASGPEGAIWEGVDAGSRVGAELGSEHVATVIDPPGRRSVRSIQQHAAARPEDRTPSPTQSPVPPLERGRATVPPPAAAERAAADVGRPSADARDQVRALVESILEQRPADRTDQEPVHRPARTDPAGDRPGSDTVLRPRRARADTDAAMAPPRPAADRRPIARPVPTPPVEQSRRTQRPVVRITIGRLEVRAQSASAPPRPSASRARQPALGLDEYLRRRSRGSR